ncbi:MBL fold metallo-hydrolase [Thermomicrobium sp. 4228-Ro]|uniref:MBL fold metallo-hydrolase n=1 Tax=Thermomicrobium sp. 4228-Ro TaxID=2993937 RepID=UPI0022497F53|nr:MBL fold metallo-hydrolase [Thermomicrobium sp. 4228-Ro]MCX2727853.1 MBL fold metallo-hydrolase [Thermomicrobium sp. 4228-Ro]
MFFQQILRTDIGCAAYVVGSTDAGLAAVVDPRIDMVDEILELLEREGLQLRYIVETHNHADHVSGHHQLAEATGATIAVSALAGVAYPHLPLHDGDELELGEVVLRAIHTPGHRPEHIVIAVIDRTRGNDPWLVLTGDTLFVGDVARPDLAIDGTEGAAALFDSLHQRLLQLPTGTLVFPGHVAGSLCGRVNNRMPLTTIGFEKEHNPALHIRDRATFVRFMNENLPERPPNLARIVDLNRGAEPPRLGRAVPLPPERVRELLDQGAAVLDVRSPAAFAASHIPGAISVALDGGQFQNRVGLVLPPDRPLVLVVERDEDAHRAVRMLAVIGYDQVVGYLAGGMSAWERAGYPYRTLPMLTVHELARWLEEQSLVQVVDVRERSEWVEGHIEGARHIPFYRLPRELGQLDRTRPLALVCGAGTRSVLAASLLQAHGFDHLYSVEGGMDAWRAAGYPVARGATVTIA